MSEETQIQETMSGEIHDLGVLDLRYAKSPEELRRIKRIHDVGVILVSEEAAPALAGIDINDVGSVVTLPSGVPLNCMTGQIKLSGEALASGDPETILFVVGQTHITSSVSSVGYKEIRIVGQLVAPRDSQAAISAKLTQITGQALYVPANSRFVMGKESFSQEFFELLPRPTPLAIMGTVTIEDDVTKEMLREKIPEIVLMGRISAPKELVPLLNVLTEDKLGEIVGR